MGSHSMQAVALLLFFAAFVAIGAGMAMGGNLPVIALGVIGLGGSLMFFRRIKAAEAVASGGR